MQISESPAVFTSVIGYTVLLFLKCSLDLSATCFLVGNVMSGRKQQRVIQQERGENNQQGLTSHSVPEFVCTSQSYGFPITAAGHTCYQLETTQCEIRRCYVSALLARFSPSQQGQHTLFCSPVMSAPLHEQYLTFILCYLLCLVLETKEFVRAG